MDPVTALGLVASIVQLIDTTTTVIKYLNDVEKAPKDQARLAQEATNLLPLLTSMRDTVKEAKTTDQCFSRICSLGSMNGPLDQLKEAMEDLAKKVQPETGFKKIGKALLWTIDKKECNEILEKIERVKTLIVLTLQEANFQLAQAIKTDTAGIPALATEIAELQSRDNQLKLRSWLNSPDPSSNHVAAIQKRQPTTGSWFTGGRQFASWKSDTNSFLWLHGIAGCGKTVLCSSIIQEVITHCQQDPTFTVVYFYFDFNDADKQDHNRLIHSLVCQLSEVSQETQDVLLALYAECRNGGQQPTSEALLRVLKQMLQGFQHSYVILDALDECRQHEDLLLLIEEVMSWKLGNLHLLATSRKEEDISDYLDPLVTDQICIQSALVEADIRVHIQERLQNDRNLKKWPANVKDEIESTLISGANGMFRWVVCQLDSLRTCLNLKRLREELTLLPRTLDDTYARMLRSIDDNGYHKEALTVLQWLCFSARPMGLTEIAEILAIDLENGQFEPETRSPEPRDALKVCSSLVTVVKVSDWYSSKERQKREELRLAHFSVKEYLVGGRIQNAIASSYSIQTKPASMIIAQCCVAYLLYFTGANVLTKDNVKSYPLAEYAAEYWTHHARVAMNHHTESEELERLNIWSCRLLETADCLLSSIRQFDPDDTWNQRDFNKGVEGLAPALYYASFAGLQSIIKPLISRGDISAQGEKYGTALQAAAHNGYENVVRLLLAEGADVNAYSGRFGTALQAAVDHENVIRLLLAEGADVNAHSGGRYGTALQAAARNGRENVVRLLLAEGADVSAQGGPYGTALQAAAAANGRENVVWLLLAKGADVNAYSGRFGTALRAAVDHENVVRLLLAEGADVNAHGGRRGTALQVAARHGHENVVRLLLAEGADVSAQGRPYGTALQAAARNGHENVVQLLLAKGAIKV